MIFSDKSWVMKSTSIWADLLTSKIVVFGHWWILVSSINDHFILVESQLVRFLKMLLVTLLLSLVNASAIWYDSFWLIRFNNSTCRTCGFSKTVQIVVQLEMQWIFCIRRFLDVWSFDLEMSTGLEYLQIQRFQYSFYEWSMEPLL